MSLSFRRIVLYYRNMSTRLMARFVCLLILAACCLPFTHAADKTLSSLIDEKIDKHLPEIIKIRRFLHMNPELGNREFETAKLVASKLLSLGLEVKTGIAKTGVTGLLLPSIPV